MATKKKTPKKSEKMKVKPTSTKISFKAKTSMKKTKASKGFPKKITTKPTKSKALKKTTSKSKTGSSVVSVKKSKAPVPSKKTTLSSLTSRKKFPQSAATRGTKVSVDSTLSSQDRYNVGGLCACVIDTSTSAGESKLRRVLTYLQLAEMDQANLYRVSQGVRIPKLFTDHFMQEEVRQHILQSLTQFAKADDSTGKQWALELEELRRLLAS